MSNNYRLLYVDRSVDVSLVWAREPGERAEDWGDGTAGTSEVLRVWARDAPLRICQPTGSTNTPDDKWGPVNALEVLPSSDELGARSKQDRREGTETWQTWDRWRWLWWRLASVFGSVGTLQGELPAVGGRGINTIVPLLHSRASEDVGWTWYRH